MDMSKKIRTSWDLFWVRVPTWLEIIISVVAVAIIAVLILLVVYDMSVTKVVFTPKECEAILGCTVKEATESDTAVGYRINLNGDLVMTLDKTELNTARSNILKIVSIYRQQGVEYSVDYAEITVDYNKLNEYEHYGFSSKFAVFHCGMYNLLKGVNPSDLKITIKYKDYETGEIVREEIWPEYDKKFL